MASKKGGAKSVAKNSGQPDFGENGQSDMSGERTVTGPGEPVPTSEKAMDACVMPEVRFGSNGEGSTTGVGTEG